MQTERKQVLYVGAQITQLVSQVSGPTAAIKGTIGGLISDLTFNGAGFIA